MSQLRLASYLVSSKRKLAFERVLRDLSFAILSLFLIAICGNSQAMAQGIGDRLGQASTRRLIAYEAPGSHNYWSSSEHRGSSKVKPSAASSNDSTFSCESFITRVASMWMPRTKCSPTMGAALGYVGIGLPILLALCGVPTIFLCFIQRSNAARNALRKVAFGVTAVVSVLAAPVVLIWIFS
jgi:hypothetical protein